MQVRQSLEALSALLMGQKQQGENFPDDLNVGASQS